MMELVHPTTGEISAAPSLSLEVAADLPFDEWRQIGERLCAGHKVMSWWLGDWWNIGQRAYGEAETVAAALKVFGKEYRTIREYGYVCERFESGERSPNLSFSHHLRLAPVSDRDERLRLLEEAEAEDWSVRELKAVVSRSQVTVGEQPSSDTCTVADLHSLVRLGKKFGTIYADPPWLYDNQGTRAATGNHYGGLTVDELCELPVRELAADDAHLHLWTTNAFLFDCQRIFTAWGFEYRSAFVWVKPQLGIGNYWRNSHEYLLTAIRGDAKRFNDHSLKSWLECDRGAHSAKPEQVRHMIERASPGPFLEMFGRIPAPNWTVWGNQIRRDLLLHDVEELAA